MVYKNPDCYKIVIAKNILPSDLVEVAVIATPWPLQCIDTFLFIFVRLNDYLLEFHSTTSLIW